MINNEESTRIVKDLMNQNLIKKSVECSDRFFLKKSLQSINVANRLFKLQYEEKIDTNLWVINASYYEIFFAATALLAKHNKRIHTDLGIHKLTYNAFINYFINEKKLIEKYYYEAYKEAIEEAEQLMQFSETKTQELTSDYINELTKRKRFTYNLGEEAERTKAETSLKRSKNFVRIIETLII